MANASPLLELERARGAAIIEQDNRLVPIRFGDPLKEYEAVQSRVGLLDLSARSFLRLSGADRVPFLNGMVSNDVRALAPGHGLHAAFLDIQGKILADARIFATEDALLVDVPEERREIIGRHLERHLVADEVQIEDLSGAWSLLSLQGPRAAALLEESADLERLPASELAHGEASIGGVKVRLIRVSLMCAEGYDVVLPRGEAVRCASLVEEKGAAHGLCWVGAEAQEMLRLEAGIPRYGTDMNENNLLLETGLDYAVSFQKGCYLGQEIVERVRSRGHVNKRLVLLGLETRAPAAAGSPICQAGRQLGAVTSSAFSPRRNTALALGYVQRGFAEPGTSLTVKDGAREIGAVVVAKPLGRAPA
ncbi:MAG TPA: aminomethyltransferase family protein [Candidatus Acidoferrales bacterium]|nr:aminomethyltransferase family protein [Candidatus Acidoferrales bacterium]